MDAAQPLSPQDEAFAQGLAYGFTPSMAAEGAGMELSQVEAKHYSLSSPIAARVQELMRTQAFDSTYEHLRIAHQLEIDRDFAYRMGNPAAAINATVQRAKLLGVYVERFDTENRVAVSNPDKLSPEEWAQRFGPVRRSGEDDTEGDV